VVWGVRELVKGIEKEEGGRRASVSESAIFQKMVLDCEG